MSDIQGISILIPIYNFDIRPLVQKLSGEVESLHIPVEIRCYDDFSSEEYKKLHKTLSENRLIVYQELSENIGRSRIRNKLAKEALYPFLLFLDSDSTIIHDCFIRNYIDAYKINSIIAGGTAYSENENPDVSLRYLYGKKREAIPSQKRKCKPYNYLNLNNLFISKEIYLRNQLDESIKTYGHEDTKFADGLREQGTAIIHIDNPVLHSGLESNDAFLSKSREAIKNFHKIILEGYGHHSRLYKYYMIIKKLFLKSLFLVVYSFFAKKIEKNLLSPNPNLIYFDLFKLKLLLEQD
jgi:hypothetical protein